VQERIGRFGRPFPFIKFRSMVQNAEREGAGILCLQADPRVSPVGRILRRTSFDELPQLFNVLRGEMSVIGPRGSDVVMGNGSIVAAGVVIAYNTVIGRHVTDQGRLS
jgi:lipopolysaccharide/colanic/teichoic acid biosynthesis glycosyltransferase